MEESPSWKDNSFSFYVSILSNLIIALIGIAFQLFFRIRH